MTTIAVFPPVLGVRQGRIDTSDLLRSQGHDMHVIDHLDGRTYREYGPLCTDPGLPEEYDPESTRILWDRVGPFVARQP